MKTGLITSDTYKNHDTGPGHPEQIARVSVINENLKKFNNKNILWKRPSLITDDIIKYTHDDNYLNLVGFFQINSLLSIFLKLSITAVTLSIFSGCPSPVL